MRSLLLVPALSATILDEAARSGADALILDLVPAEEGPTVDARRALVRDFLLALAPDEHRPLLYLRVSAVEAEATDGDLAAVMAGGPDGVMLGRCRSRRDLQHLAAKLAVHEADQDLEDGETAIVAAVGASAESLFGLGSYVEETARLLGLSWDADAFAADLGCETLRGPDGGHTAPVAVARSMTLIAARAAAVAAIDGPSRDLDPAGFQAECEAARRDGFNAKIAATADQVAIVNAVFDRDL